MRNKAQGFTLVELLIVIAIIGILSAVLIPNLLNARKNAQNTAAQAYAKNVVTWIAAADTAADNATKQTALQGVTTCVDAILTAEGASAALPSATSGCSVAYAGGRYTVSVTSVPGTTYTYTY